MRRLGHRFVRLLVLILAVGGMLGSTPPAQAAETLDQSQTTYVLGTGRAIRFGVASAQTFVAGLSGNLTRVEVALWYNTNNDPVTVEIHALEPGGPLLASTQIPASDVIVPFAAGTNPSWVTASFSSPATLEAGTTYAIVLSAPGASNYIWAVAGNDAYASGTTWVCNPSDNCLWSVVVPDNDTAFKTYVDVPTEVTIVTLYDESHPKKSGSTVPVTIQVNGPQGDNISAATLVVHAVSLTKGETTIQPVPVPGRSQRDAHFTFDPSLGDGGGYQFNVKTTGLDSGTWSLNFTVGDDPTTYTATFLVR